MLLLPACRACAADLCTCAANLQERKDWTCSCALAGAPRMLRGTFLYLCKRCGVLRCQAVSVPRVAAAFGACAGAIADTGVQGLDVRGFAKAMAVLAALVHPDRHAAEALQLVCEAHFAQLEEASHRHGDAVPSAALLTTAFADFSACAQHRAWLARLFRTYAAGAAGGALQALRLPASVLRQLCKDLCISPRLLTSQAVSAAFESALWPSGAPGAGLCFEGFLDAVLHLATAVGGFMATAAEPALQFADAYSTPAKQLWLRSQVRAATGTLLQCRCKPRGAQRSRSSKSAQVCRFRPIQRR